mmetsp:Transcript_47038/g.106556  ORF Transcript_47038/g.106556 Transcript_47038/m.106556 type:complete len:275 (+) Transcript_47038:107-931(+)
MVRSQAGRLGLGLGPPPPPRRQPPPNERVDWRVLGGRRVGGRPGGGHRRGGPKWLGPRRPLAVRLVLDGGLERGGDGVAGLGGAAVVHLRPGLAHAGGLGRGVGGPPRRAVCRGGLLGGPARLPGLGGVPRGGRPARPRPRPRHPLVAPERPRARASETNGQLGRLLGREPGRGQGVAPRSAPRTGHRGLGGQEGHWPADRGPQEMGRRRGRLGAGRGVRLWGRLGRGGHERPPVGRRFGFGGLGFEGRLGRRRCRRRCPAGGRFDSRLRGRRR